MTSLHGPAADWLRSHGYTRISVSANQRAEGSWTVMVSAPGMRGFYHEIDEDAQVALERIKARIEEARGDR